MKDLRRLAREADLLMTLGTVPLMCPFLMGTDKPLILDAYDPFLLAGLELHRGDLGRQLTTHEHYRRALLVGLGAADFVLCASERQRDYWLGMMSALGRVNPYTYRDDPGLRRILRVVPFGLPSEPPRKGRSMLKGVHPAIGPRDRVVLWGGGLWDWLDAETAIRAMARIEAVRTDVKLVFMGTERPSLEATTMTALERAVALSRRLGLLGRSVIFNTGWVPYAERQGYLLEADVAVCLHRDVLETRFAFRTRLLDCVWAALPVVATRGDVLGEEMHREGLARLVRSGAEDAVAEAILDLLDAEDLGRRTRPRFEAMAARYRWDVVASPLVEFCLEPRLAPDRAHRPQRDLLASRRFSWARLAGRVRRALGGVHQV
jgi:hypothetical protein